MLSTSRKTTITMTVRANGVDLYILTRLDYHHQSLPPSLHLPPSSRKRKASEASGDDIVAPRKGSKRSKPVPVMCLEAVSIMLQLPPYTPETRQTTFSLNTPVLWTAEEFYTYWPLVDNLWVCNKPNIATPNDGSNSSTGCLGGPERACR